MGGPLLQRKRRICNFQQKLDKRYDSLRLQKSPLSGGKAGETAQAVVPWAKDLVWNVSACSQWPSSRQRLGWDRGLGLKDIPEGIKVQGDHLILKAIWDTAPTYLPPPLPASPHSRMEEQVPSSPRPLSLAAAQEDPGWSVQAVWHQSGTFISIFINQPEHWDSL